jgi:hypothetical protein
MDGYSIQRHVKNCGWLLLFAVVAGIFGVLVVIPAIRYIWAAVTAALN